MLLRGQVSQDQLKFDEEIEKTARRNRGRRRREQQSLEREQHIPNSDSSTTENREEIIMADPGNNPLRRILGDYAMQQGPRHFSSIAIPNTTKSVEMKPTFLSLISNHQFTGMDREDPYTHLSTFYELLTLWDLEMQRLMQST